MTALLEFRAWPKTPRMNRNMVITEKIDGTNAAVIVKRMPEDISFMEVVRAADSLGKIVETNGVLYIVGAQSRKRLITPQSDNFGFASWVFRHAETLADLLGEGYHYGEWWGSGIQRGYGLTRGEKRFSLFNVNRYTTAAIHPSATEIGLSVVPVLYAGPFDSKKVNDVLVGLKNSGSWVTEGFDRPEGIIVFHEASGDVYKVLAENDEVSKTEAGVE